MPTVRRPLQAAPRGGFPPTVITSFERPIRMLPCNGELDVGPAPSGLNPFGTAPSELHSFGAVLSDLNPFGTIANIKSKSGVVNLSHNLFGMLPKCHFR